MFILNNMKSICLVFQVHQPVRFRRYRFFDIGANHSYVDLNAIETNMQKLAKHCYLPANDLLLRQIERLKGKLKVAFYISGVTIEQFLWYAPEVYESFKKLAETGCIDFLSGTYSGSLASLFSPEAFREQSARHQKAISDMTGHPSTVYQNTGMIYSDEIGSMISEMGYKGVITEGARHILGWKSPDLLYCNAIFPQCKVLFRNSQLSDDLTFRFSDTKWSEYPLTLGKFLSRVQPTGPGEEVINIALEYETLGSLIPEKSGILSFLDHFIFLAGQNPEVCFTTPSEVIEQLQPVSPVNVPDPISWNGEERDQGDWTGNDLQGEALSKLYGLVPQVRYLSDPYLTRDWNFLQSCDHFDWMSTRQFTGPRHHLPNPYESPFDAFINYMNILNDFKLRLDISSNTPEY